MINDIKKIFSTRAAKPIGQYRNSAVLLLLQEIQGEYHLVFEVRSNKLNNQPGDICLPGGMIEEGEKPKDTAIREAMEELNLNIEDIQYVGEIDYLISPYGMFMYSFVGITNKTEIIPSEYEVDHIFTVPLNFFINNEPLLYNMEIGPTNQEGFPFHLINRGKEYKFRKGNLKEYFYQYKKYVIWGFTAQVIKSFIDIIKENNSNFR